jgi:hypothetical protein
MKRKLTVVGLVVIYMLPLGFALAQSNKPRLTIPLVRVTTRPTVGDLSRLPGGSSRRATRLDVRVPPAPAPLPLGDKVKLLRENGINVTPPSTPNEFRLSPRAPYVSASAYLFFSGDVEFNASADSLSLEIQTSLTIPRPHLPGLGEIGWTSGGPQPDPPAVLGVLVRMEAHRTYLADFSVSSDAATSYQLTVTGASGSGTFPKEAGGQHVLVALHAHEPGYVRINFSASRSFTFHNVVVTKIG